MRIFLERLEPGIVSEIIQYISITQLLELRAASRSWRAALAPAAGTSIVFKDTSSDDGAFSKFLQFHGNFTKSITIERIDMPTATLLGQWCKKATSLTICFPRTFGDEVIDPTLNLAAKLPGLNAVKVEANFGKSTLKKLGPIIERVTNLILECGVRNHEKFLDGLSSPSVKRFSLLGLTIDVDTFVELIKGFKNLEEFQSTPNLKMEGYFGFSYHVQQQRFKDIHLVDGSGLLLADVWFNVHGSTASPQRKKSRTSLHRERFNALEKMDPYFLISKYTRSLPSIRCIYMEIDHDPEERDELDNLNEPIQDFRHVSNVAVNIKYKSEQGISMACVEFKASSLYFNSNSKFNGSYTLWLLNHFPFLQDLYMPSHSPNDLVKADSGDLKFKSLQRVFVYREQRMRFWEKLVQIAPTLTQINICLHSPRRTELMKRFPHLLIGVYSLPKYFKLPLSLHKEDDIANHSIETSSEDESDTLEYYSL